MTPKHVAASMAALNQAATPAAAPIAATAGSGTAYDTARAAARKAGAAEERTRIGAILNHEAAAGRGKLAAHLAFKTDMGVADAGEMLAASATEGDAMWAEVIGEQNARLGLGQRPAGVPAAGGTSQEPPPAADASADFWGEIVAEQNTRNGFHREIAQ